MPPEETIDYSKMTEQELDALLKQQASQGSDAPAPAPEVVEPVPEAPPVPEPEVVPEPTPEAATETQPSIEDDRSFELEGERLKRERLESQLALDRLHNSRLAGEIGYLREQLKSIPRASEPYEPQTPVEMDRLDKLEQMFRESESRRTKAEVSQAVETAISALDDPAVTKSLASEIASVAPMYADRLRAANEVTDPQLARQLADAIGRSVIADAKELAWTNRRKALDEKVASQAASLIARKKAATVSGSGATSAEKPADKTVESMTIEELDRELKASVRRR